MTTLDFEKSIQEVEEKINALRHLTSSTEINISDELRRLEEKLVRLTETAYKKLTPWQKVQVARHENRPQTSDYIQGLIQDFVPLRGDKAFGEDRAILGGIGRFNNQTVVILGQERGRDTQSRLEHNFGMAKPEGYRKAIRLMRMAEHFKVPILTFVDTSGAFPGMESEARGQAEAIAQAMNTSFGLSVPIISTIIGEGGSGGAVGIATGNIILMLEHSIYSVISPEGCASILWKDATKAPLAAQTLHLTAQDLYHLKVIDEIIPEHLGGAHRHKEETIQAVGNALARYLGSFNNMPPEIIKKQRQDKFENMTRL